MALWPGVGQSPGQCKGPPGGLACNYGASPWLGQGLSPKVRDTRAPVEGAWGTALRSGRAGG